MHVNSLIKTHFQSKCVLEDGLERDINNEKKKNQKPKTNVDGSALKLCRIKE